jgi:hypothetical protein
MTDEINCGKVGNVKITRAVEAEEGFPGDASGRMPNRQGARRHRIISTDMSASDYRWREVALAIAASA